MHLAIVSPYVLPCILPGIGGPFGGAEVQLAGLARGLYRLGHRVDIVCLRPPGDAPDAWEGGRILTTFREGAGVRGLRFAHPRLVGFGRALMRSEARTLILRSASGEAGLAAIEARLRGRSLVLSLASEADLERDAGGLLNARDRALYRIALRRAHLVVAQSARQEAAFVRIRSRARVVRIPSWVEAGPPSPTGSRDGFVFVGAIRREKRAEILLDAAAALPDQRFVMLGGAGAMGEQALFEQIRARASALPNVEMRGFVPASEVRSALAASRALVNTSEYEGFPNAFLEAWASGAPVVSVSADPDELICTQALGIHVRSIDALVPGLKRLVAHPDEAAVMGARGREYVLSHHDPETVVRKWEGALLALEPAEA